MADLSVNFAGIRLPNSLSEFLKILDVYGYVGIIKDGV
jgi:hypothetical protein